MIEYKKFQFACPPAAGGGWFYRAPRPMNLVEKISSGGVYSPFDEERNGCPFRVSLVRHPCTWIGKCYDLVVGGLECKQLDRFRGLDRTSLDAFVQDYIDKMPGEISNLFMSYEADSYMRVEDMPWAFFEFVDMMGFARPEAIPKTTVLQLATFIQDKGMRRELIQAEERVSDGFDYY